MNYEKYFVISLTMFTVKQLINAVNNSSEEV